MAEEAAFLASMQAANEYGVEDLAGGGHVEQHDADEYEPSQTVQPEIPPPNVQDPNTLSSAHTPSSLDSLPSVSAPPVIAAPTPTAVPQQDPSASDRQSLSRSMSPASSQSLDNESSSQMHHNQITNGVARSQYGGGLRPTDGKDEVSMDQKLSIPPISGTDLSIATDGVPADIMNLQNDVQDQTSSRIVQNGAIDTVPNLAAVLPDTGAASHDESTAKPAETLPAPLAVNVSTPAKNLPLTPSASAPRARLPHDTIGILEDRIKEDPRGDIQAWLHLLNEHKKRGKTEDARSVYERFLGVFPAAVCFLMTFDAIKGGC